MLRDLRFTLRTLARNWRVTLLALASLALAIGANTAVFSIVDAVVLRPLPIEDPRSLVELTVRKADGRGDLWSWDQYSALADNRGPLGPVMAQSRHGAIMRTPDGVEMLLITAASPNYFEMLGIRPAIGRTFTPGDPAPDGVVLSDRAWKRRFGGDPQIVGRAIPLNIGRFRVLGVMPPDFSGLMRGVQNDLWVSSAAWLRRPDDRRVTDFEVYSRLEPGVTLETAGRHADAVIGRLNQAGLSAAPGRRAGAEPFGSLSTKETLAAAGLLAAMLSLVLAIACANVANLRLARNEARRREIGIRLAIGAGRSHILGQEMLESAVVALAGMGAGLVLAAWLARGVTTLVYSFNPYTDYGIRLDARSLLFALGAALAATLLTALGPVLGAWRQDIQTALRGSDSPGRIRARAALAVLQIVLCTALAGTAGLFWKSLANVTAVRPAMDPDRNLLLVEAGRTRTGLPLDALAENLAAVPGARAAAYCRRVPLAGSGGGATVAVSLPGQPERSFHYNQVSPNYFEVTGARVLAGRAFTAADSPQAAPVVMISQAFARRFFQGRNALGEWVRAEGRDRQVVGIVEDGPVNYIRETVEPFLYFPHAQMPGGDLTVLVEGRKDAAALAPEVRKRMREAGYVVLEVQTLRDFMKNAHSEDRALAVLSGGLGLLGVFLAASGLFGVLAYTVSRRTREFGIRLALGAVRGNLERIVLASALKMAFIGVPAGIGVALACARLFENMLFGVSGTDPLILGAAALLVTAVALAAAFIPARHAARVNPLEALRWE
jgi:predicted permease